MRGRSILTRQLRVNRMFAQVFARFERRRGVIVSLVLLLSAILLCFGTS